MEKILNKTIINLELIQKKFNKIKTHNKIKQQLLIIKNKSNLNKKFLLRIFIKIIIKIMHYILIKLELIQSNIIQIKPRRTNYNLLKNIKQIYINIQNINIIDI